MDIKICGLRTEEALAAALAGGASHVGFIFFAKSPRNIAPAEAGRLRQIGCWQGQGRRGHGRRRDATLDEIVEEMAPDMLQLHGSESPERVAEIKARYGLPVIKALPIRTRADLDAASSYRGVADRLLFDAKPPKDAALPGGNGVPSTGRCLPASIRRSTTCFLAASTPPISARHSAVANPPGIDISSGVESTPGIKDARLIEEFFRAVADAQKSQAA